MAAGRGSETMMISKGGTTFCDSFDLLLLFVAFAATARTSLASKIWDIATCKSSQSLLCSSS